MNPKMKMKKARTILVGTDSGALSYMKHSIGPNYIKMGICGGDGMKKSNAF
jgi:hypothetical protein